MIDILLVDDRPYGLMAMEAVLDNPEYNLVKAGSGQEAIASLYGHDFAVILLDVQMPVMDGFETARLIRQYAPSSETPIIFITAINKDSHQISRGYESGAIDYLFKPIDPDILRSKVKIFAELYRSRQMLKKMNEDLEARVRERTAELIRTNKELEQFVYIASHDLQEPLRKIVIFGDRLKEEVSQALGEKGKDYLERMRKASVRMKNVIEDLLMFSKIGAQANFERVDLQEVLAEIKSDLEIKIAQSGAIVETSGCLPPLTGNKSQIHHLFQNLIANAIKFAKKDVTPVIRIECDQTADAVNVRVSDNGIGFDEKYLEHIFKMFQRLHPQHEYEGSGIGLSICQKIVQQHGGQITARSTLGEGSTFVVTLPHHPQAESLDGALLAAR
jgi:signal transduction histidine kinase